MIVEDEKPLQEVLKDKISSLGYLTVVANNGDEAIEKYQQESPDFILLDIVMPYKNGFEILEELRIKYKSKVPVIIVSNLSEKEDVEMAMRLGANDYIIKSNISLRDLTVRIASLIGKK